MATLSASGAQSTLGGENYTTQTADGSINYSETLIRAKNKITLQINSITWTRNYNDGGANLDGIRMWLYYKINNGNYSHIQIFEKKNNFNDTPGNWESTGTITGNSIAINTDNNAPGSITIYLKVETKVNGQSVYDEHAVTSNTKILNYDGYGLDWFDEHNYLNNFTNFIRQRPTEEYFENFAILNKLLYWYNQYNGTTYTGVEDMTNFPNQYFIVNYNTKYNNISYIEILNQICTACENSNTNLTVPNKTVNSETITGVTASEYNNARAKVLSNGALSQYSIVPDLKPYYIALRCIGYNKAIA